MKYFMWVFALFVFVGVASAVCEATGEGTCYYIDPVHGDDTNDGSIDSPWQTFMNIQFANWPFPPDHVWLNPGDVIYLREGLHNTPVCSSYQEDPMTQPCGVASFRRDTFNPGREQSGTAEHPIRLTAFPGERAVVGRTSEYPEGSAGLGFLGVEWWEISDIEVAWTPADCMWIANAQDIVVRGMTFHNCARKDTGGNPAGLELTRSERIEVSHSTFYDTFRDGRVVDWPFDHLNWDSRGMGLMMFRGSNITVHNNLFFQTKPARSPSGAELDVLDCVLYKHAQDDPQGFFHFFDNTLVNCQNAVSTGTQNSWIYNNLLIDVQSGFGTQNAGGPTIQQNQTFESNTVIAQRFAGGDVANPMGDLAHLFPDAPQQIVFRNNVVYNTAENYNQENNLIDFATYRDIDDTIPRFVEGFSFENNCYFNPYRALRFNVKCCRGNDGGFFTFDEWQAFSHNGQVVGFDAQSVVADPEFVNPSAGDYRVSSQSACFGRGAQITARSLPVIREADVTGSGTVAVADLLYVVNRLGQTAAPTGFAQHADINNDGVIDLFDLVLVARSFGS